MEKYETGSKLQGSTKPTRKLGGKKIIDFRDPRSGKGNFLHNFPLERRWTKRLKVSLNFTFSRGSLSTRTHLPTTQLDVCVNVASTHGGEEAALVT